MIVWKWIKNLAHINNEKDRNQLSIRMKLPVTWMLGTSAHQKQPGEYFNFPYQIVRIASSDWQSTYHEKSLYFFNQDKTKMHSSELQWKTRLCILQTESRGPECKTIFLQRNPAYHYVFHNNDSVWKPWKNRAIGRLYTVSVKQVERHCLRLLLINVKGPQSFQHLQTAEGVEYPIFKLAAIALNLLEDDRVWENTMTEAATYQMPHELR